MHIHACLCVIHTVPRYRPEVAAAVKSYAVTTPAGVHVDIVANVDGTKVAVEGVGAHYLSAAGTVSSDGRHTRCTQ